MPDLEQPVDDPQVVTRRFRTPAERRAFIAGVEYVNDSAISVRTVGKDKHKTKPYFVRLVDRDRT